MTLAGILEEHLGDTVRDGDAAHEGAVAFLHRDTLRMMAQSHRLLDTFRKRPLGEQPAADIGMIGAQSFRFMRNELRLGELSRADVGIEIGHCAVECHDADILNQRRQKQFLCILDADEAREHTAGRSGQQSPPPVQVVVEAAGALVFLPGLEQREGQRQ